MDDFAGKSERTTPHTRGVVWITSGEVHTLGSIKSAKSVRRHSRSLGLHLFSDSTSQNTLEIFDSQTSIPKGHRRSKVDWIWQTPFDETLYLDADTLVLRDIENIFGLLEKFDFGLTHSFLRNTPAHSANATMKLPPAFAQFNGGFMLFRKSELAIHTLKMWQHNFYKFGFTKDQVALRESIWVANPSVYVLPPEYNFRALKYFIMWSKKEAKPAIYHSQLLINPYGVAGYIYGQVKKSIRNLTRGSRAVNKEQSPGSI